MKGIWKLRCYICYILNIHRRKIANTDVTFILIKLEESNFSPNVLYYLLKLM